MRLSLQSKLAKKVNEGNNNWSYVNSNDLYPNSQVFWVPNVFRSRDPIILIFRVAILGDTSYGECCVDGIAAKHVGADSIIHFGDTCFSFTETLPVLYIFTQCILDVDDLNCEINTKVFKNETIDNKRVAIFYDVHYYHIFFPSPLRGKPTVLKKL